MSLVIDLGYSVSETALRLGVSQSWHWIDTEGTALGGKLTGDPKIEPFANAAYVHQRIGGFNESGGAATLSVDDAANETGSTTLDVRGSAQWSVDDRPLALHGSVGWRHGRHALGDLTPQSTHAFADGAPFTVSGTPLARDTAVIGAGIDLSLSDTATLGLRYDGQAGGDSLAHAGRVRFTLRF